MNTPPLSSPPVGQAAGTLFVTQVTTGDRFLRIGALELLDRSPAGVRNARSWYTQMLPPVKWWRLRPTAGGLGYAGWFDPTQSYPGFQLRDRRFRGNVRVFRDLAAFAAHDGALSMDLSPTVLDEVLEPGPLNAAVGEATLAISHSQKQETAR